MQKFFAGLMAAAMLLTSAGETGQDVRDEAGGAEKTKHVLTAVFVQQQTAQTAVENRTDVYTFEYDEYGRLLEADSQAYSYYERYTDPQFIYYVMIPGRDHYEYNDDGTVSKVTRMSYDEEPVVRFTVEYEYEDGKLAHEFYTNGDKLVIADYIYDEDGVLSEVNREEGNGNENYVKLKYHGDGKVSSLRSKKVVNRSTFDITSSVIYNADNRISEIHAVSGNMMSENSHFTFRYEENGDLRDVGFVQGYFEIYYLMTFEYRDIPVKGE